MHHDSFAFLLEDLPLADLEADPVGHRRGSRLRPAVPHDLMSGGRIVLAGAISAEMGDEPDGVVEKRELPAAPVAADLLALNLATQGAADLRLCHDRTRIHRRNRVVQHFLS